MHVLSTNLCLPHKWRVEIVSSIATTVHAHTSIGWSVTVTIAIVTS